MADPISVIPSINVRIASVPQLALNISTVPGLNFQAIQSFPAIGGVTIDQLNALSGWAASQAGGVPISFVTGLSGYFQVQINNIPSLSGYLTTGNGDIRYYPLNNISGFITSGQTGQFANVISLGLTGSVLDNKINSLSGFVPSLVGITNNLTQSGVQIELQLNSLSGYINNTSGILQAQINLLPNSGVIAATGQQNYNIAINNSLNLSGNLTTTGQNLYNIIAGLSGQGNNNFATISNLGSTGQTILNIELGNATNLSGNLFITGSNIYKLLTGLSGANSVSYATIGNLTLTGVTIESQINSLSGFSTNFSGTLQTIANNTIINLGLTGNNLYNWLVVTSGSASTSIANLQSTGQVLYNDLIGLSGQSVTSANLQATGQATIQYINSASGALVQQIAGSAAGVSLLNGASGSISLISTGENHIVISVVGQKILISGSGLANSGDISAIYNNLTSTGVIIGSQINSLSGFVGNTSGVLQTQIGLLATNINLTLTGQTINNSISLVSGNLTSTGSNLYNIIAGLSGQLNTNHATVTNLTTTGSILDNKINSLSGYSASIITTNLISGNIISTGSTLDIKINSVSGFIGNVSGGIQILITATNSNLILTGSNLYNLITGASGQYFATNNAIALTGANLYNWLVVTSGQIGVGGGATVANLALTGSTLDSKINNLSGYTFAVSGVLQTQIGLGGGATVGNLQTTGQTLYNDIIGLSGSLGGGGVTTAQLTGVSGALITQLQIYSGWDTGYDNYNLTGASGSLIKSITGNTFNTSPNQILTNQSGYIYGDSDLLWNALTGVLVITSNSAIAQVLPTNPLNIAGSQQSWLQINIQNTLVDPNASSDYVATADNGNDTVNYIDLGINSSTYNNTGFQLYGPNDGYVLVNGGNHLIGTDTPGKTVKIFTDGDLSGNLRMIVSSSGITVPTGLSLNMGTDILLPNNPVGIAASVSGYLQVNIQNKLANIAASADYIATADNGNDGANYIDMGINNSVYSQTGYSLYGPNDGYVYVNGGNHLIGVDTPGKTIKLFTDGDLSGNLRMQISLTGAFIPSGNSLQISNVFVGYTGIANKPLACYYESGWGTTIIGPALYNKQMTVILPAATTNQTIIGDTAANAGTLSTAGSEILGDYTNYISTATGFQTIGTSTTTAHIYRGSTIGRNGFFFVTKFALANLANAYAAPSGSRFFAGLTDQALTTTLLLNDPAGNRCGLSFCYQSGGASANRFDTNWSISSKNNTTETLTATTMNFNTGFYRFGMYCKPYPDNNTIWWQLDDLLRLSGVAGTMTSAGNLPVGGTAMRPMVALNAGNSGVKSINTSVVYVETLGSPFE